MRQETFIVFLGRAEDIDDVAQIHSLKRFVDRNALLFGYSLKITRILKRFFKFLLKTGGRYFSILKEILYFLSVFPRFVHKECSDAQFLKHNTEAARMVLVGVR